jgi:hypothetical protein
MNATRTAAICLLLVGIALAEELHGRTRRPRRR